MRARLAVSALAFVAGACGSHRPPVDFAPDPGLVAQIKEIRITTAAHACPGQSFAATYTAILTNGTAVPFETRYDKDRPPRLHVIFLDRSSPEADPLQGGGWSTDRDPLIAVRTGYRLTAVLRHKPDIQVTTTVPPEYTCLPHAFTFSGRNGRSGNNPGGDGPDITVRLAIVRSPFVQRLIVAALEVGDAPPFYLLADANTVPPRDWLIVQAAGGQGGSGLSGSSGLTGPAGVAGCPGTPGGPGGNGEDGSDGAPGGRGGRITIIAPTEEPFLSGLVSAEAPGGRGGAGGSGGSAGHGGKGGAASGEGPQCVAGADGSPGSAGSNGRTGSPGVAGPRPRVLTVPTREVFGPNLPPDLAQLLGR